MGAPGFGNIANLQPPWQPGKSANERSGIRGYRRLTTEARKLTPEALATITACMRDPSAPWPSRLKAAEVIIDRAWGAPDQKLTLEGDGIHTLRVEFVDPRDNADRAKGNGTARTINGESFEITFDAPKEDSDAS